ncbi:MAG TPA: hypothetical protein VFT91_07670 [Dehalococcoidia bacterium]|nr:hypothetical protein [Dehalococcoidia bacterium]
MASRLDRLLAWEIVAVHAVTGALYVASVVLVAVYIDDAKRWVLGALAPFIVFLWLGWMYEAWIILRMSSQMRRQRREKDTGHE